MTPCAYRSLQPVLRERIQALCERRAAERGEAEAARRVAIRRIGWAFAGGAGAVLGALMLVSGLLADTGSHGDVPDAATAATCLLLGAWPAALLAGLVGIVAARLFTAVALDAPVALSGDTSEALARIEAEDPLRNMRALAARWELASTALPLAALSLTGPLTIHWFVAQVLGVDTSSPSAQDFGRWIGISALIVGHAHLALVLMAVLWARSLRTCETFALRSRARGWWRALLVAVGAAAVPGIVLLAIPPVLVLLTGLIFVPAMYLLTARRVERERLAMGMI